MNKQIIAEFGINIDNLIVQAQSAKGALDALRKEQKELTKSGDTSSKAFIENAAQIKNLSGKYNAYTKTLQASIKGTDDYTKAQETLDKEMKRNVKSIDGARESNKALLAIRNKLDLNSKKGVESQQRINEKLDQNNKFIKDNVSALEKQKINIGNYAGAIGKATESTGELGQTINFVTNNFTEYKTLVQDLSSRVLAFVNVTGDMADATNEASKSATQAKDSTKALGTAQKATATATGVGTKSMKAFRIALISTGIGAIVVAVVALVAAFASTQAGADALARGLAPVKGAFQGIIGVVQQIATNFEAIANGVFGQFKDNFTILVNTFLKGTDAMRLGWAKVFGDEADVERIQNEMTARTEETNAALTRSKERAEGFVKAVKDGAKAIGDAADNQSKIVEKNIELEESQIRNVKLNAEYNKQIKEQNKLAEDISKPIAEREAAAVKSVELAKEKLALQRKEIQQELEILKLEASSTDTSREDRLIIAQKEAELDDASTASLELQTTQTNKVNQIRQSGQAKQAKHLQEVKKAQQEAIKAQEVAYKLFELQSQEEERSLEEKKNLADELLKKELEIIDAKAKAGLSDGEADIARIESRRKAKDAIADIVEQEKKIESDRLAFKTQLVEQESKLETNKEELLKSLRNERRLLEATTSQEQAQIQLELSNQNAQNRITNELANLRIEEDAKREQKLEFDLENAESDAEKQILQDVFRDEKLERDLEFQEASNIAFQELDANYKIKKKALDDRANLVEEVAELEKFKSRVSIAQKGANDLLTISDAIFGKTKAAAIAGIVIGRAASIGQIIANTGIANAKAVAASPLTAGQPFVAINSITAGLSVAASVASGAKAISKITSTKAEKGIAFRGTLKGASHANGGIDLGNGVEAEGGENIYGDGANTYVMNKQASGIVNESGMLGALSYINQNIGGGVPLTTPTTYAMAGGSIQAGLSSPSSQNQSNQNVVDGIAGSINTIKVINVASETDAVNQETIRIQNRANN